MEFFLIIIILAIVIAIGYILSRPFTKPSSIQKETTSTPEPEVEYQALLQEIKAIELACKTSDHPNDACIDQLNQKKQQAADLLRVINPSMEAEVIVGQTHRDSGKVDHLPMDDKSPQASNYCPQCGVPVMQSDKFCMHCGHRLEP